MAHPLTAAAMAPGRPARPPSATTLRCPPRACSPSPTPSPEPQALKPAPKRSESGRGDSRSAAALLAPRPLTASQAASGEQGRTPRPFTAPDCSKIPRWRSGRPGFGQRCGSVCGRRCHFGFLRAPTSTAPPQLRLPGVSGGAACLGRTQESLGDPQGTSSPSRPRCRRAGLPTPAPTSIAWAIRVMH